METITFVTGNINKLNEVKAILIGETGRGLNIVNKKLDLPELQGEPEFVAREKCRLASIEVEGPVLSEDTSLCFNPFYIYNVQNNEIKMILYSI